MSTKSIRVSDDVYKELVEVAGTLQIELKHSVSFDEAIRILLKRFKSNKISDLAGTWDVGDDEMEKINESLKTGWKQWNPSV